MRYLLTRWIIRRLWALAKKQTNDLDYGNIGQRFNMITLVSTVMGGHTGWIPDDVESDFRAEWLKMNKRPEGALK